MNTQPKPVLSTELRINGRRLWDSLMEMAKIGATPKGGVCRLALTDLDRDGRDLFVRWAKEAGCTITVDQMGNVFARRAGRDDALAPVVTGSHADSQPTGGKFDGIYGVLGGLEVIRSLNDHGIETERPVEAVIWTNEEGSRFAPAMVASGVFAGVFTLDYGLSRADIHGVDHGPGAGAHRLCRRSENGQADSCRIRAAHRTGADSRSRGQDHRRGHARAGTTLVRSRVHRSGIACRTDADAAPQGRAARRRARDRSGQPHRSCARAAGLRDRRHDPEPSELAQRDSRPRVLHHRHPPSRRCRARGDGPRSARRRGAHR